jgi:hypothetical protein
MTLRVFNKKNHHSTMNCYQQKKGTVSSCFQSGEKLYRIDHHMVSKSKLNFAYGFTDCLT